MAEGIPNSDRMVKLATAVRTDRPTKRNRANRPEPEDDSDHPDFPYRFADIDDFTQGVLGDDANDTSIPDAEKWNRAFSKLRPPGGCESTRKKAFRVGGKFVNRPCEEMLKLVTLFRDRYQARAEDGDRSGESLRCFLDETSELFERRRDDDGGEGVGENIGETPIPPAICKYSRK